MLYLCICICVFVCETLSNISFDILGPRAFRKDMGVWSQTSYKGDKWIQIFGAHGQTPRHTVKGVLRGPRGPKKFAFRSFLLSIVEHILPLYDNAPSHELRDYCARVGDEEISCCEL